VAYLRPNGAARIPRALHPIAWWIWALGLAVAVSRTTNPLLLVLVLGVLGLVVSSRRTRAPWARAFKYYLALAGVIIVIRIVFRVIFAAPVSLGDHVLFDLPTLHTPGWYAGIQVLGPVTLEAVLAAAVDGLRLGTLMCCIGAANALANPRRALRVLPGALYELGIILVVAISIAPQLVESIQRVRNARRLRAGSEKGLHALGGILMPVLEDALDRSLLLAAAMDSRGYGRQGTDTPRTRRLTGGLLVAGLLGLCAGAYGLLDGTAPSLLGLPSLAAGAVLCVSGLVLGSRRVTRTTYRPDPWLWPEWVVAGCGVLTAVVFFVTSSYDPLNLTPVISPLAWPTLPLVPTLAVLLCALPAVVAPPPVRSSRTSRPAAPAVREPVRA
jgi:energy-coupling factor transport system permease protein